MKLFLDTNVVLDLVQKREPFVTDAALLFQLKRDEFCELIISDLTFVNVAYIIRKFHDKEQLYILLTKLRSFLTIVEIGSEPIDKAIALRAKDFEDAVQYYTALKAGVDYIITRNKKDFSFSKIDVLLPHEFLIQNNINPGE